MSALRGAAPANPLVDRHLCKAKHVQRVETFCALSYISLSCQVWRRHIQIWYPRRILSFLRWFPTIEFSAKCLPHHNFSKRHYCSRASLTRTPLLVSISHQSFDKCDFFIYFFPFGKRLRKEHRA